MEGDSIDLRSQAQVLVRRWRVVTFMTVLGVAAGLALAFSQSDEYTARAEVLVEPLTIQLPSSGIIVQPGEIETQIKVIESQPVAQQVIEELHLAVRRRPAQDRQRRSTSTRPGCSTSRSPVPTPTKRRRSRTRSPPSTWFTGTSSPLSAPTRPSRRTPAGQRLAVPAHRRDADPPEREDRTRRSRSAEARRQGLADSADPGVDSSGGEPVARPARWRGPRRGQPAEEAVGPEARSGPASLVVSSACCSASAWPSLATTSTTSSATRRGWRRSWAGPPSWARSRTGRKPPATVWRRSSNRRLPRPRRSGRSTPTCASCWPPRRPIRTTNTAVASS